MKNIIWFDRLKLRGKLKGKSPKMHRKCEKFPNKIDEIVHWIGAEELIQF